MACATSACPSAPGARTSRRSSWASSSTRGRPPTAPSSSSKRGASASTRRRTSPRSTASRSSAAPAVENILSYDTALATFISNLADAALRRREAERRAEALARFPQENPDPVFRLGPDLRVEYANPAALSALAGLGLSIGALAPPDILGLARRALSGRERVRGDIAAGDRSYAVSVGVVGAEVNVYAHDITTRVRAEEALHGTMQRLESLLENSPLAVIEWSSVDFRVSRWSDEATRMFGWTSAETVGKRIDELDWVYPEDRPLVEQVMSDMLSGRRRGT